MATSAVAKNPRPATARRPAPTPDDAAAESFIEDRATVPGRAPKTAIMLRIPRDLLARADRAAIRLGISRSAFLNTSIAEKIEQMERRAVTR